jgi:hypothetical protein
LTYDSFDGGAIKRCMRAGRGYAVGYDAAPRAVDR